MPISLQKILRRLLARSTNIVRRCIFRLHGLCVVLLYRIGFPYSTPDRLNLCSGPIKIPQYLNVDICPQADLYLDLEQHALPFRGDSFQSVICISSINYFSKNRARFIIKEVYRVLQPGGIARFATQDFRSITEKYLQNDTNFFFEKLPNGKDRFIGDTICDKINSWFYGYAFAKGRSCRYFYDFETLAALFHDAGFRTVEKMNYTESRLPNIELIDNRPDQMFFLEAVK